MYAFAMKERCYQFARRYYGAFLFALPIATLPSSAAFAGRSASSFSAFGESTSNRAAANVNVTVNGVVGAPRDVADEIARIVTRTLSDLNRRGA